MQREFTNQEVTKFINQVENERRFISLKQLERWDDFKKRR